MKPVPGLLTQAFRWSNAPALALAPALASALGMAVPVLVGAMAGALPLGLACCVGALAIGGVPAGGGLAANGRRLLRALVPGLAASLAASLIGGRGAATGVATILLALAAAVAGGYDRRAAESALRFVPLLIISVNLHAAPHRLAAFLAFAAGALWTALLSLFLGSILAGRQSATDDNAERDRATPAQKWARLRKTLAHVAGWNYTLRLGLCLAAAQALQALWPEDRLYWAVLTVALLTRRGPASPLQVAQRALGTALGVALAGVLVAARPALWVLVLGIGVLAGARPLLRERNYLAYSAVMTPLILLIVEAGTPLDSRALLDRLGATVIGAVLVLAADLAGGRYARRPGATGTGPTST